MKIRLGHILLIAVFSTALIYSCGNSKELQRAEKCKKNINEKDLTDILFSKDTIPFEHFYTKIGVDFDSKNENRSFNATVKMRVDSAFSGTIKLLVVAATYLVTMDSVIFVNKLQDCYFREHLDYVSSLFGTDIEYAFFQNLILGLPLGLDPEIKYKQIHDKYNYILSSHKKKKFRRLDHDRLKDDEDDIFIQYYLDCDSLNLERVEIQVPVDTVQISVEYKTRKIVNNWLAPDHTILNIVHPRDSIQIRLNYGTIHLNERKEVDISIPDSYHECP